MERSEPTLVPQWLKSTGNVTGGGNASHHFASPSSHSHSDEPGLSVPVRNRSSLNIVDFDNPHSPVLADRTSSSYFRRSSSSNGAVGHDKDSSHSRSYNSFGRSYRDRDYRDILDFREKDRSGLADHRDRDYSDADMFTSRIEKDIYRRSHSMISGKRGEMRSRRVVAEASNKNNHHSSHNGSAGGSKIVNIHKTTFERDFPSLGVEERQGVERVASPGLSISAQSLPMGTSAMIMGNGWTSALAEVPVIPGSNSTNLASVTQTAAPSSVSSSSTTGLNMAETLAQAPLRTRTAPQLSIETQRLEELAIKQSRQLIPMTPSMPKSSVLNSEKQKPKLSVRNDIKIGQQLSSLQPAKIATNTSGMVAARSDGGKLLVLKSARENGSSSATNIKDSSSPTAGRTSSNPLSLAAGSSPTKSHNSPRPIVSRTYSLEKKPINSHAQSRNDFFNLMRKKTLANNSSSSSGNDSVVPVTNSDNKCSEMENSPQGSKMTSETQRLQNNGGENHSCPDEEEAAFLRSLGWEEDAGEEEGLTQEEINAFYQEYMKLRPSSKLCQGLELDLGSGSGSSSCGSKSEA
ncbi:hypothetical protein ACHQM5_017117 [Ranunculus cassubicifolius]